MDTEGFVKRNPTVMRGSKLVVTVTIDPDQVHAIDEMAETRRTSRAALFREALDLFIALNIARNVTAPAVTREAA